MYKTLHEMSPHFQTVQEQSQKIKDNGVDARDPASAVYKQSHKQAGSLADMLLDFIKIKDNGIDTAWGRHSSVQNAT